MVCQVRAPVTPTLVPRVQVAVRRATRAAFLSSVPVQEARTSSRSLRWSVPSAGSGVAAISAWREDDATAGSQRLIFGIETWDEIRQRLAVSTPGNVKQTKAKSPVLPGHFRLLRGAQVHAAYRVYVGFERRLVA